MLIESLQMGVDRLMVRCDRPGEDEKERLKIWEGAQIPEEFALLDIGQIFDRLKPFVLMRSEERNWFEFMRWILWKQE